MSPAEELLVRILVHKIRVNIPRFHCAKLLFGALSLFCHFFLQTIACLPLALRTQLTIPQSMRIIKQRPCQGHNTINLRVYFDIRSLI